MWPLGGGWYIWEEELDKSSTEMKSPVLAWVMVWLRLDLIRLRLLHWELVLSPTRDANPWLVASKLGFAVLNPWSHLGGSAAGVLFLNICLIHYVFSREVRKSLYEYTMCKHKDLRTCKKVDELWSLNRLTLKFINHSLHSRWPSQKASLLRDLSLMELWLCLIGRLGKAQERQSFRLVNSRL